MPRLLVLTQTHNLWGGIESWMGELFPALEDRGWEIEFGLAQGRKYNDPVAFVAAHRYIHRWHALDGRVGTPSARRLAVRRVLAHVRADVMLPIAVGDAVPALRRQRLRGLGTRWLAAVHSSHLGTLADLLENRDMLDMAGFVSGLLYRWGASSLGLATHSVRWLRNGAPPPVHSARKGPSRSLRVGFVGRLEHSVKRAEDLAAVIAEARALDVPLKFTVVGDGPSRSALEASLRPGANQADVSFLGHLSRESLYSQVYPTLDCLLLTSIAEGSPLVVIEAMQHGIVPVVSRFHGLAAEGLLQPERNCLTFPVGDGRAAAEQLRRLAFDLELRGLLADAAWTSARDYTTEAMIDVWTQALTDCLSVEARVPSSGILQPGPSDGRLTRLGIPTLIANGLRRVSNRQYPHGSGFEEWPGSLSENRTLQARIEGELETIECDQASRLYSSRP